MKINVYISFVYHKLMGALFLSRYMLREQLHGLLETWKWKYWLR
jgi:hypothetical protein